MGFRIFWKLVGWFSSSAKLLFRFSSTLDYLKICKFIAYWLLESVNIKKSLITTGMPNWNWTKFGADFCCVFQQEFTPKTGDFFLYYSGVWTLACWNRKIFRWCWGDSPFNRLVRRLASVAQCQKRHGDAVIFNHRNSYGIHTRWRFGLVVTSLVALTKLLYVEPG